MHQIKYKFTHIVILSTLFGIGSAWMFVAPYEGVTSLTELVLQLSGSRGSMVLGDNFLELLQLSIRFIPTFIFELYIGTELYHYFCTASVYIFSRMPDRLKWYRREMMNILFLSVIFELVLLLGAIFTTVLRYQVQIDPASLILCAYHVVLYSLWICAWTVLVNVLAIYQGSNTSFIFWTGIQLVLITLLSFLRLFEDNASARMIFMNLNPIAHLVLGWHSSSFQILNQAIGSPYQGLDLGVSLILVALFCLICILVGGYVVKRHDLLSSDIEMEAF